MNYYERHIGDYLKNTAHLSLLEHGIYTRLMDVYYTREDGIPVDQVERLIGVRSKDERAALSCVLDEFFEACDGMLRQHRCDKEIARFQDKQRKAKASADARWSNTERNANAMRTHTEGNADGMHRAPVPSPQSPDTKPNTPKPPPDGFDDFWSAYPKKVGKPAAIKAFRSAKINGHMPQVLADIEEKAASELWTKAGGQFIPNPATYLNQRRWEDEKPHSPDIFAGAI